MSAIEALSKLLEPMRRQINGMVSRVVVRKVNDAPGRQELQVTGMNGELLPVVEHFQPFGISGYPPTDIDGIGVAIGGYRNHVAVLAASPKVSGLPEKEEGDTLHWCINPAVFTHLQAALGFWRSQGDLQWFATLRGLSELQYVKMTVGRTEIYVEDKETHKFARITLSDGNITLQSSNGGTHVY